MDQQTVEVGTNLAYANSVQFGGVSEVRVTMRAQDCMREHVRQHPEHAEDLKPYIRGHEYTLAIHSRARPFIMVTDEGRQVIQRIVAEMLTEGGA